MLAAIPGEDDENENEDLKKLKKIEWPMANGRFSMTKRPL